MKFIENKIYRVTGIMSGTSLDGMDLAACNFVVRNGKWEYSIEHAATYSYSSEWRNLLESLYNADARDLAKAHFDFGRLIGEYVTKFHEETGFDPMLVASHGHTIFHDPASGYTMQIGSGAAIASLGGKPVVCDFRSTDVCLGGQGAPLVPIGDQLLFSQYDACLNLGGFSNISLIKRGKRIAFDICPVNTVLNKLAHELGHEFDENGNLARQGKIIPSLLDSLNKLPFHSKPPPKSLGTEWLDEFFYPAFHAEPINIFDKLRTFVEHVSQQITKVISEYGITKMLVSGGGAFNTYLIERVRKSTTCEIIIPDVYTINYKEALIFALLGLLRWFGQTNCLASATGASKDSVGGAVFLPVK